MAFVVPLEESISFSNGTLIPYEQMQNYYRITLKAATGPLTFHTYYVFYKDEFVMIENAIGHAYVIINSKYMTLRELLKALEYDMMNMTIHYEADCKTPDNYIDTPIMDISLSIIYLRPSF
jgi:hypothetical protein